MAIIIPPYAHTAFNPIICKVTGSNASATAIIYDSYGNTVTTLKRDAFNGTSVFDFQSVIKYLFKDERYEIDPVFEGKVYGDKNLYIQYYARIINSDEEDFFYRTVLNAVAQIRQSSNMASRSGSFLTEAKELKKYEGYPLSVAFLSFLDAPIPSAFVYYDNDPATPFAPPIIEDHFVIDIPDGISKVVVSQYEIAQLLQNNNYINITTNFDTPISVGVVGANTVEQRKKNVTSPCGYNSYFYVRWINRIGGYEYFMFDFRQTSTIEVKNIDTYSPNYYNQQSIEAFDIPISGEGKEVITAGAQVTNDEYDRVSKLVFSPKIEWYNKEAEAWVRIQVDKSKLEKDSRAKSQNLEFEFLLPAVQMQY